MLLNYPVTIIHIDTCTYNYGKVMLRFAMFEVILANIKKDRYKQFSKYFMRLTRV